MYALQDPQRGILSIDFYTGSISYATGGITKLNGNLNRL